MKTRTEKLEYIVWVDNRPNYFDNLSDAQAFRKHQRKYIGIYIDEIVIEKILNFTDDEKVRLGELMWQGGRNNFFETFCEERGIEVDFDSQIFCEIEEYILEKIKEMNSDINERKEKKLERFKEKYLKEY
jgi:hypothetical protein